MTPERVRQRPPLVLDQRARERYFEDVRGQEPLYVHMEPYPARLPPRWDEVGYRSIFAAQAGTSPPAYVD